MARRKKKKKIFTVRFELSLAGLFGVGIVCFCIFLWMFLLGIWAGQTVLQPMVAQEQSLPLHRFAANFIPKQESAQPDEPAAAPAAAEEALEAERQEAEPEYSEPTFFTLQVASFRDPARAKKAVLSWRSKGYDTFSQDPDDSNDQFTRVFVGKFEDLADASALAARLEARENVKAFIALLPASKIRIP